MNNIFVFDPISVEVPVAAIYKRMGFVAGKTSVAAKQKKEIDAYIAQALGLIELKGAACRKTIVNNHDTGVELYEGIQLTGKHVSSWLVGCQEVLVMASTCGRPVMDAIAHDTQKGDVTRGVVFDAAASVAADAGLDWLMGFFATQLRRENKTLNRKRFSCGFGDFALSHQRLVYDMLELQRLKIELTPSCILIPEKSVTAFAGIK